MARDCDIMTSLHGIKQQIFRGKCALEKRTKRKQIVFELLKHLEEGVCDVHCECLLLLAAVIPSMTKDVRHIHNKLPAIIEHLGSTDLQIKLSAINVLYVYLECTQDSLRCGQVLAKVSANATDNLLEGVVVFLYSFAQSLLKQEGYRLVVTHFFRSLGTRKGGILDCLIFQLLKKFHQFLGDDVFYHLVPDARQKCYATYKCFLKADKPYTESFLYGFGVANMTMQDHVSHEEETTRKKMLHTMLIDIKRDNFETLLLHMEHFISFLSKMLLDISTKVRLYSIVILETLVEKLRYNAVLYLDAFLQILLKHLDCFNRCIRKRCVILLHQIVCYVHPMVIVPKLVSSIRGKSSVIRGEIVSRITASLFSHSFYFYDFEVICCFMVPILEDLVLGVRQLVIECLVTLCCVGKMSCGITVEYFETLLRHTFKVRNSIVGLIVSRVRKSFLPLCNSDGIVKPLSNVPNIDDTDSTLASDFSVATPASTTTETQTSQTESMEQLILSKSSAQSFKEKSNCTVGKESDEEGSADTLVPNEMSEVSLAVKTLLTDTDSPYMQDEGDSLKQSCASEIASDNEFSNSESATPLFHLSCSGDECAEDFRMKQKAIALWNNCGDTHEYQQCENFDEDESVNDKTSAPYNPSVWNQFYNQSFTYIQPECLSGQANQSENEQPGQDMYRCTRTVMMRKVSYYARKEDSSCEILPLNMLETGNGDASFLNQLPYFMSTECDPCNCDNQFISVDKMHSASEKECIQNVGLKENNRTEKDHPANSDFFGDCSLKERILNSVEVQKNCPGPRRTNDDSVSQFPMTVYCEGEKSMMPFRETDVIFDYNTNSEKSGTSEALHSNCSVTFISKQPSVSSPPHIRKVYPSNNEGQAFYVSKSPGDNYTQRDQSTEHADSFRRFRERIAHRRARVRSQTYVVNDDNGDELNEIRRNTREKMNVIPKTLNILKQCSISEHTETQIMSQMQESRKNLLKTLSESSRSRSGKQVKGSRKKIRCLKTRGFPTFNNRKRRDQRPNSSSSAMKITSRVSLVPDSDHSPDQEQCPQPPTTQQTSDKEHTTKLREKKANSYAAYKVKTSTKKMKTAVAGKNHNLAAAGPETPVLITNKKQKRCSSDYWSMNTEFLLRSATVPWADEFQRTVQSFEPFKDENVKLLLTTYLCNLNDSKELKNKEAGMLGIIRISKFCPEKVEENIMNKFVVTLMTDMKNLKTSVAGQAALTIAYLFQNLQKLLESKIKPVFATLLLRAGTKTFSGLQNVHYKSLHLILEALPYQKGVLALIQEGGKHPHKAVREVAAQFLAMTVHKLGPWNSLCPNVVDVLLATAAHLLLDASALTRYCAQLMFQVFMQREDFDILKEKFIPSNMQKSLSKGLATVNKMKKHELTLETLPASRVCKETFKS